MLSSTSLLPVLDIRVPSFFGIRWLLTMDGFSLYGNIGGNHEEAVAAVRGSSTENKPARVGSIVAFLCNVCQYGVNRCPGYIMCRMCYS